MNAAGSAMPVLGLLTGVSYVSGVDYFRGINEKVTAKMPPESCQRMQKNARLVLACVDWYVGIFELEVQSLKNIWTQWPENPFSCIPPKTSVGE